MSTTLLDSSSLLDLVSSDRPFPAFSSRHPHSAHGVGEGQ